MRAIAQVLIALGLLLLGAGAARAQEKKLTVAIFAPNAPFESGDARYNFISKVAQQIQSATGYTVEPKAFARGSDFEAALKKNQVDFAVVDGVYLAQRGVPYPVLAIATSGGDTQARWALYASEPGGVMEFQQKRLALAATSSKDQQFVDNALLDGELPRHFSARQTTPDIFSAVQSVALKKADCVFAPEGLARGLRKVFEAGRVPNPALVQVSTAVGADVTAKVKGAVVGGGGGGTFDGWRAGSNDPYRSLAGRLGPKVRRPVMSEPEVVRLDEGQLVAPPALEPALPDLKDQFWNPSGMP